MKFFSKRGITWKFIAEQTAWWGEYWDHLVQLVKTCLKNVLGRASLSFEEMCTVLTEVKATLNSRPLTFVHNEENEAATYIPTRELGGIRWINKKTK